MLDDSYVLGILHDMGKIVFSNVHPDLLAKINNFCKDREIQRNLFEDLSAGLNHAEIGARIAIKWNFPDVLVEAIKHHHEPTECSEEYRGVVYTVYLANALANIEKENLSYDILNKEVLQFFGINSKAQFDVISKKLEDAFVKEKERDAEAR